jgi:hypothetical protein
VFRSRITHRHTCGHFDDCYLPQFAETTECKHCVRERFQLNVKVLG